MRIERERRLALGLNLRAVAVPAELSRAALSRWEREEIRLLPHREARIRLVLERAAEIRRAESEMSTYLLEAASGN